MDELLTAETCQEFFVSLLATYNRHDANGILVGVWMNQLEAIECFVEEYVTVMSKALANPPERMPAVAEIVGLIKELRAARTPRLPAAQFVASNPRIDVEQARQNRIALLRGIYKHQGDTPFYRAFLKGGNVGMFGDAVNQIFERAGISPMELVVTHEDVLESMKEVVRR